MNIMIYILIGIIIILLGVIISMMPDDKETIEEKKKFNKTYKIGDRYNINPYGDRVYTGQINKVSYPKLHFVYTDVFNMTSCKEIYSKDVLGKVTN